MAVPLLLWGGEEEALKRIYAHLFVHDPRAAVKEAEQILEHYPDSYKLKMAHLQALAEKGDEIAVLQAWKKTTAEFQKDRHALEILAWGVLQKGDLSPQVNIHVSALIGAALTRDVRAVPMIVSALRSTNSFIRMLGVKFSTSYGDGPLQEELQRLLVEEKVWYVRLEVMRAVGAMRIASQREILKSVISNPKTMAEEKAEAIIALVHMYDGVRPADLDQLIQSNRAGLRQLACQLVAHFDLKSQVKRLAPLLSDASPDVRSSALHTIALLKSTVGKRLSTLMADSSPMVAITAAWVATLQGDDKGIEELRRWMSDIHPRWRVMAAATVAGCGARGVQLALEEMEKNKDPFVRVNLALGLIGQRVEVAKASHVVYDTLHADTMPLLMWDESFHFRMLSPSFVGHIEQIPNYPKVVDQMVRLDLLNILCIVEHPKAQEAVKGYVKNETWGVSGAAVAVLLEQGDEEAMKIVKDLLNDPDRQIRVQAAFILSMIGNDPKAIQTLQEAYPFMNRDLKIHILEAIGHVGSLDSIPFLVDILGEPFQMLRVVAASAIIQCLYH